MSTTGRLTARRLIETAHLLADASGPVVLRHFRKPMTVDNKAEGNGYDPVTKADRAAERIIRRHIAKLHPDHAILGEEMGLSGEGPYTWVIDPIDGTRAFITGMPLWGTLIGVTEGGRAVAGMMDQPYTRERVWSAGDATHWRGSDGRIKRIKSSGCTRIEEARLMTTSPDLFSAGHERKAFERLKAAARMTRFGGDCYAYCLLAAGHVDIIAEAGLKAYDIVALVPIIEAAGGSVTTWDGGRPEGGGRIVASASSTLHDAVLRSIASG
ncbi:MAG: histidinol-phosphatase [Hyphomicrobiaceae bacterium]|nr:histidinol-phosphatase [Hyphomicrobiaceae bacterium]